MTIERTRPVIRAILLVLLFGYGVPANAISLITPAVHGVRLGTPTEPAQASIGPLGSFDAVQNGGLPIYSLDFSSAEFDTTSAGDTAEVMTEMVALDLVGTLPVLFQGDPFNVIVSLSPPGSSYPGLVSFLTTSISPDGSSASGELRGAFNFTVEVALFDVNDPGRDTTFLHDDSLEFFALWHSEGRNLIIDSPVMVSGMIEGSLQVVPLPAGAYLFLSGLFAIGLFSRRRLQSA